ncbi:MAG TPA: universal stress protein, partial [Flavisolibacter sp.]|nr:universal stress protein [Flavisolibacter sp.]
MKTILAPVDFSDAAANALSFAAELARRAAARLVVTTVLDDGENEEEAKTKLQATEAGLKNTFGDSLACTTTLAHGSMVEALQKTIAGQQTDLLVMGTKGASGLKKMLIGSNTVNVIAGTRVPVLVIPEVARFENFLKKEKNNIVLATDLDSLENDSVLQTLKQIALLIINPTVKVLSVRPKNTVLSDEKRWERDFLLSVFDPEIESERITIFC